MAGDSEWWLRLPSAVAIGVAAAFLLDLGRRLHSSRAGLAAAGLFAVLPAVSYHGANARPYAFAAAAAVISFWALHRAVTRPTGRRLALYGASVALLGCTHLFAMLVVPAQLVIALWALPPRMTVRHLLPAVALGCLPAAAFAAIGFGERHAISWIPLKDPSILLKFPKMATGDQVAGTLLLIAAFAGAAVLWLRSRRPVRDRSGAAWAVGAAFWFVLPPLLMLVISYAVMPVYVDRYLFVTVPGLALLGGIGLAAVPWASLPGLSRRPGLSTAVTVLPSLVLALIALPVQIAYRSDNGHYEDFRGASRVIEAALQPGDAILYGQSWLRTGFRYYGGDRLPEDVAGIGTAPDPRGLGYPERADLDTVLKGRDRVWIVWRGTKQAGLDGDRFPQVAAARRAGLEAEFSWHSAELPGLTVALFTR
ncbi:glycosyltransferase family 39 protein [Microtetraspora sp. NBRC 16547]|uniref:glycosyltransferase family 39 protein n=1 Tax=Microtetraspora sp. NBRC 16547 TaxID=3030993 RepID=UPI0025560335|nr:glycosyltransferase family 39 protein [Microtetraspora sp. NBRC 16547]